MSGDLNILTHPHWPDRMNALHRAYRKDFAALVQAYHLEGETNHAIAMRLISEMAIVLYSPDSSPGLRATIRMHLRRMAGPEEDGE